MKPFSLSSRYRFLVLVGVLFLGISGNEMQAVTLKSGSMASAPSSGSGSSTSSGNANSGTSQTSTTATTATSQAAQTTAMAQNAQNSLQHSLQALQAQQAAQSAARAAVLTVPSTVPNGLVIGGLVPDSGLATSGVANPVTTWVNANTPTQSSNNGQTTVTVTQTAQQALLNWQTFNIGKDTTLAFDQSAGGANVSEWVAINKVAANIAPSEILGTLTAQGQVYVINQNGIIFGGSSQVNVGALVASSLPINDNLVNRGLLNNPDDQFLFSQGNIAAGTQGPTDAFNPSAAPIGSTVAKVDAAGVLSLVPASGHDGDVVVQAGAQLSSPTTAEHVGGKIALVGPNVVNAGTIATPDGQTIVAAGNQVGFAAHNANDPSLRGLDVYVGTVDGSSGMALNAGLIDSPRADITMAGKNVVQNGVINSSTSVALNGRIDLLADYGTLVLTPPGGTVPFISPTKTGTVTLGQESVTQILPELSSTDTVVGTQLALSSLVNIQGETISLNQDALLWAPSANVPSDLAKPALGLGGLTLSSGVTLNAGNWLPLNNTYSFFNSTGQISLASGSSIDVSGSQNVAASILENIITAQLLGTELADSPLQQNGPLRGQTIEIDLRQTGVNADGDSWIGTPLGDVSGYVNLVQHTVGELTTNGGTVALNAGGSVDLQAGSTINVSGGWINYQGGIVQTTQVVSGGQVFDISQATPDRIYDGIYTGYTATAAKWGISQTYANALLNKSQYQAGYIQGGNGGSLSITAPTMTVDGKLLGNTVAGSYQRTLASQLSSTYAGANFLPTILATKAVPQAAALSLSFEKQNGAVNSYPTYAPTPPKIDFGTSQAAGDLVLSSDLVNVDGFGRLTINNGDGSIFVPADVALTTQAGGSITLKAANIDIEGSLSAPSGTLSLYAYDYSPYAVSASPLTGESLQATPPADPSRGQFTLGTTGSLSVAGLIVDDRFASSDRLPLATNGGTIAINAYSANLAVGSTIDASGGVAVSAANKVTYGSGGSLSIKAGQDPNLTSLIGGNLVLGSTLSGYSGTKGGSLTIQAPLIQIGGTAVDPSHTLLLSPDFFDQDGFASFTLNGLGEVVPNQSDSSLFLPAVSIADGITINPIVQNWVAGLSNNGVTLTATTLPLSSQRTPVSLAFGAKGVSGFGGGVLVRGDFVLGANSVIITDPKGSVAISGNTAEILGSIIAPGGKITINGASNSTGLFSNEPINPAVTVDLGPNSLLSTAGVVEFTPNAYGYTTGSVLSGGTISIAGNILAETGAVLDVSGASGILDVAPAQAGLAVGNQLSSLTLVPTRIDSNGGSITLTGGQEMVSQATLRGAAGGLSAQGGSLTVSSHRFDPSQGVTATTPLDVTLEVTQGASLYAASGIGNIVLVNGVMAGHGYFDADSFVSRGLGALNLGGTVQFSGPVTIQANRSLDVGDTGIIYSDAAVNLIASYVKLGQAFQGPLSLAQQQLPIFVDSQGNRVQINSSYGTGSLTVQTSGLIDVGNLSLQNIGNLNLIATNGDIRGDGTLDVAGNINLTAGQIYPTTDTTFTIAAHDHGAVAGTVTINASGSRQLPFSAGGILNVYASNIVQGGVLRAPLGTINLGSGVTGSAPIDPLSGQAFDSTKNLTLASGSITSVSAVDPVTGQALVLPYGTNLNGISWIDPAGNDITVAGNGANAVPDKAIHISGASIDDQSGATIDISGGGDLYSYRFVSGTGGTQDILASTTSFAIVPGYSAAYAPYYSSSDYANTSLGIGSQIYLSASSGLPAGVYTLLPARYALLPGAFLVTPTSSTPAALSATQPDGSSQVAGYRFNGLDQTRTSAPLYTSFEVASQAVVRSRAEYDNYSGNTFLSQNAQDHDVSVRLPTDAGQLVLAATHAMTLQGTVSSRTSSGGLGSQVDIASPSDILISGANTDLSGINGSTLVLDSSDLSSFGADSLLIGGYRTSTAGGTTVTVTTSNLTVDNAGTALQGPDVILTSNQNLTLETGAAVEQSGALSSPAEELLLGNSSVVGSGNGVLLRVSSDATAQIHRSSVTNSSGPSLTIGAGATIAGASLILDSTSATSLDPAVNLSGKQISLNSGQISLVLDDSQPASGLVLSSSVLGSLQNSAQALSLLSYSSIDIYEDGNGSIGAASDAEGNYQVQSLALHAKEIRGFDGGTVSINARNVTLDNSVGGTSGSPGGVPTGGALAINAETIQLGGGSGANALNVNGYADLNLNASGGVLIAATKSAVKDSSGNAIQGTATLTSAGNLHITAPVVTGATGANQTLAANGNLTIDPVSGGSTATVSGGLGATLKLVGASVTENSLIRLPSGNLSIETTGANGNVVVGGSLDVGGTAQPFNDLIKYTSGGQINLTSDNGSVILNSGSTVSVATNPGGGNGGTLNVSAKNGILIDAGGALHGQGGTAGQGGTFSLDVGSLSNLDGLDPALNTGGFTQARSIRVRHGDVVLNDTATAQTFNLSADGGSITVNGTIDASGKTGGAISLEASGSVTLASGSKLTVAGLNFNDAGKGGSVTLEAGSAINGVSSPSAFVDIQAGSTIDLSIAANSSTSVVAGNFTGTLHIRAPQTAGNTDLQVDPINGSILGASSIVVEGYKIFDASSDGSIDNQESNVFDNGQAFAGNTSGILNRLFNPLTNSASGTLQVVTSVAPGAEIISAGDLVLASDWDLSSYRFGPNNTPGVLTIRAAGNLIFQGSLSDGFNDSSNTATLMSQNTALPVNAQSWSYRLVAGSDLGGADFRQVMLSSEVYDPATGLAAPGTAGGSLELGNFVTQNNGNPVASGGTNAKTSTALDGYYQVIRTGTGDIDIATSGDVLLQNQFATIYTAGTKTTDPKLGGLFDTPILKIGNQTSYAAQYSLAGGNVTISAQGNIAHVTQNNSGTVVLDSEKELPNNWLYRRGYVDPATGQFGQTRNGQFNNAPNIEAGSTSWWIDFSNFFEGIGALGGGNVTLTAGHDVSNVDAVAPTNARMTKQTSTGDKLAAHQTLVELGGGDVTVQAGNNINGGVYYVERGQGTLEAGQSIVTNFTRSASTGTLTIPASVNDPATWLPTTLFLGKGNFDVTAQNDLLLGPVSNPFLLPQGVNNTYWDKTYFSTYATTDEVNLSSLTGTVTLRESATMPGGTTATPLLQNWLQYVDLLTTSPPSVSYYQPWLRVTETSVTPFATVDALLPASLRVTAFSGDINTVGNLTLSPSPTGTIDLVAAGSINALQPNGVSSVINSSSNNNATNTTWSSSTINLSDANPNAIPGIYSPYAYQVVAGTNQAAASQTEGIVVNGVFISLDLSAIDSLFAESGSTEGIRGVLQNKLKLHANIDGQPLHADDYDPVHLYAQGGDISGLTLFSGKAAQIVAGQDITDIAFYLQNVHVNDVSLVVAGRDLIAYDATSSLRTAAQATGNVLDVGSVPLAGDIQIGGPGTLEVLAGRNLNLGVGPNNADGTGVGITSIGYNRNPALPFAGADIVALAGIGDSSGLDASKLNFNDATHTGFIDLFLNPGTGGAEASRYLPELGNLMGLPTTDSADQIWTAFNLLSSERQDSLAVSIFYLVLRDAGRDHNTSSAPGASTYQTALAAIGALFPSTTPWQGDISLTSREIKTTNGGNISLLAPGGQLDVGLNVAGGQAADQGILTEDGGDISIFTHGDVNVGTSRIFTLNGGNEIIWSSSGDIAAGASSKTVQSAPPTRVRIDPQSGAVQTDLAGLATGGGIGTLSSSGQQQPSDIDLIAPNGTVNAGDAGIRSSGNLNIAAVQVLNAGNIQTGGQSTGVPTVVAPNVAGLTAASTAIGATSNAADQAAKQARNQIAQQNSQVIPSIITVEVLGYGGSADSQSF